MTRRWRTACCLLILWTAATLGAGAAMAQEPLNQGSPNPSLRAGHLTAAEATEKARQEAAFESWRAALHKRQSRVVDAPFYYLFTPSHKQINNYYCGPASVQIIDDYWGDYCSQIVYARHMGVTSQGTDFTLVDDALRCFTGVPYYYRASMDDPIEIYENVQYALYKLHRPLVCDVRIDKNVWNRYNHTHAGHIVPIEGFDWRQRKMVIRLNDPYNEADYYTDGGQTYGHQVYPRGQIARGILTSLRRDLIW